MSESPRHVRKNRGYWESEAEAYQRRHGETLTRTARAWGVWRIPEEEVNALGDLRGRDVLELGCGAAQWSIALQKDGANVVGLDLAAAQLRHARGGGASFPLVQASAESIPLRDASFDVVFGDHGAMGFADPRVWVPEAGRVLRRGGLLVACMDTPFHFVCWDDRTQRVEERLSGNYFELRSDDDEETIQFQLPYGEWIRLFRSSGFQVEDLIELRPPERSSTTYTDFVPREWARRWPAEHIWRCRRR